LHVLFGQHCVPEIPQITQVVPWHRPPFEQLVPGATHSREPVSQHPLLHAFPAQQTSPSPPQVWQMLFAQPSVAARQVAPEQHGWPDWPHWAQIPPLHAKPPAVH
jgi:hypothetical protein